MRCPVVECDIATRVFLPTSCKSRFVLPPSPFPIECQRMNKLSYLQSTPHNPLEGWSATMPPATKSRTLEQNTRRSQLNPRDHPWDARELVKATVYLALRPQLALMGFAKSSMSPKRREMIRPALSFGEHVAFCSINSCQLRSAWKHDCPGTERSTIACHTGRPSEAA